MGVFETNLQFYSDLESKEEQAFKKGCDRITMYQKQSLCSWLGREKELRCRSPLARQHWEASLLLGSFLFALFLYQGRQAGCGLLVYRNSWKGVCQADGAPG